MAVRAHMQARPIDSVLLAHMTTSSASNNPIKTQAPTPQYSPTLTCQLSALSSQLSSQYSHSHPPTPLKGRLHRNQTCPTPASPPSPKTTSQTSKPPPMPGTFPHLTSPSPPRRPHQQRGVPPAAPTHATSTLPSDTPSPRTPPARKSKGN